MLLVFITVQIKIHRSESVAIVSVPTAGGRKVLDQPSCALKYDSSF